MVVAAINGMLASLDPHSTYLDAKALTDFQTTMKGEEFGGLGLEVMQEGGLVRVVSPIDDTPAARAGMMSGDLITAIDDAPVQGMTLKEAVDKMRGPAKTSVRLKVSRGANKEIREFTIVREIIKVLPVRSRVESGDIGYIRITQFNQQTLRRVAEGDRQVPRRPGGRQIEGLHPRLAQQSRGIAHPVDRSRQRFRRPRRDRIDAGPHRRSGSGIRRQGRGRFVTRQAHGGADQRRLGFRFRDRLGAPCRISSAPR